MNSFLKVIFLVLFTGLVSSCSGPAKEYVEAEPEQVAVDPNPNPNYLPVEETLKSFHLPKGYKMELVADESILNEPVAIAWDGNGRMFVAEMCTYMQDVDGTGTEKPKGKILLLEDTNGDGKMDKHSVFIDSLLLPRMILPLDGRLLVNETYTYDIWSYEDTNGDGVADKKERLFHEEAADNRNLEHQTSGLIWNLDNWIYTSRNPIRFKYKDGKILIDSLLDAPSGQWGLANDEYGKFYYSSAGGEEAALGFQQHPAYGSFELKDQLMDDFDAVWPIIATPDVQGGLLRLRPDSTLNHFTASCGQVIFQGDHLPSSLRGDLLICEPVGRLIRRAKVINRDGQTYLKSAYNQKEFLASTDMNFRPVNLATGPDGSLYIVDIYRGIIQESNWTREGSFLRPVIKRMKLDENFGKGRIYRLVYEGDNPGSAPNMLNASTKQLVEYLAHPNGWWRNTAQKLLVVRNDKSVVPQLEIMATGDYSWFEKIFSGKKSSSIAKIHALWTLNGLDELKKEIVLKALNDEDAQVRKAGIWSGEEYIREQDAEVIQAFQKLKNDASWDVRIQLASSLRYSTLKESKDVLGELKTNYPDNALLQSVVASSMEASSPQSDFVKKLKHDIAGKSAGSRSLILKGATIFKQLCATCHGADGKGVLTKENKMLAPPLVGSKRLSGNRTIAARILLNGLSGPVDGKTYPDIMSPMAANDDEWIASVLTYARYEFGGDASTVWEDIVTEVREETKDRKKYWTIKELEELDKK